MRRTLDGFPFKKATVVPNDPRLNTWSRWGITRLQIADYYINKATVVWHGVTVKVADYGLFIMLLQSWAAEPGMNKEKALDLYFEISV